MIQYLKHKQIDKEKWNNAIASSSSPLVYALSWYLDIVSPDWEALVEDDYNTVMPLTKGPRFGIRYLRQPFFCQQLGVFSNITPEENKTIEFLLHIPAKYKLADIKLSNQDIKQEHSKFFFTAMPNYILNLNIDYDTLRGSFSKNTKRNISKARKQGLSVSNKISIADIVQMKKETAVAKLNGTHISSLLQLLTESVENGSGRTYCVLNQNQKVVASLFLIKKFKRIIYLISSSTIEGKNNKAMFLLVDHLINKYGQSDYILDFEGSNIEGVARFFSGFGASPEYYTHVFFNRLPKIIKTFMR